MKAAVSAEQAIPIPIDAQVEHLWAFISAKAPRFTRDSAQNVINGLRLRPGEDVKSTAKRLRAALKAHRIELKHTNALHAASQLFGATSWHTSGADSVPKLTLLTLDVNLGAEKEFGSWDALSIELRAWTDRLLARGMLPLGVLKLAFNGRTLTLSTAVPPGSADERQVNQEWPLGIITPIAENTNWLEGAPSALEKLRRHLEESGHAVLDGYAVLRLCADVPGWPWNSSNVSIGDVVNSELVLMREDEENDPYGTDEIARGDELTCWHQLELSFREKLTDQAHYLQITTAEEGAGAWRVNGRRYIWIVETLRPKDYVPGRVSRQLGISDCERLLRRYMLAKRIHGRTFKHHERAKQVEYLGGLPQSYRVDLHYLLHELSKVELDWESYVERFCDEVVSMANKLPAGFVFQLIENLKVENPNKIFAKPNLVEMERIDDDRLLLALRPRVQHVRYVKPAGLDVSEQDRLREAVEEFAEGLRVDGLFASGGLHSEHELPHLVWATEAMELRLSAEALGLVMYAATIPHLISTEGVLPEVPGIESWPWAAGNALFLRFERDGGV